MSGKLTLIQFTNPRGLREAIEQPCVWRTAEQGTRASWAVREDSMLLTDGVSR